MKTINLYKETSEADREKIKNSLREKLEKADRRIYQIVTKVAPSGMSRHIKSFIVGFDTKNKPTLSCIDYDIACLLSNTRRSDNGVFIEGCGMDMGFSIVYALGSLLYPKGDGKTITHRNGDTKPETDGGYLLKQEWV